MFNGYLTLAGKEIINSARFEAYMATFLPMFNVLPISGGLRQFLGQSAYVSPTADKAPWYDAGNPATAGFYGLYPVTDAQGSEDSTRTLNVSQLSGDGAVHSRPRHQSREIRFSVMAVGADDAALSAGVAWLRNALDPGGCAGSDCTDWTASMVAATPSASGAGEARYFYRVQTLEGPRLTKTFSSRRAAAAILEFVLHAGVAWPFSVAQRVAVLPMATGYTNFADPAGEDCSAITGGYDRFISDPFFTAIVRPPAAPVIKPPNIIKPSSWRRKTAAVPVTAASKTKKSVPVLTIAAGASKVQQMRIRFYPRSTNLSGCDFAGEFLLSYLPENSTMTIDGRTGDATVRLPGGVDAPGGHLLYGSDGTPATWPVLACSDAHTMVVDLMPGTSTATVTLDVAVRE